MKLNKFFIIPIFFIFLYSEELSEIEKENQKNMNMNKDTYSSTKYKTYKDATNDKNVEKWNTKDFQKNQGGNTGVIGNTQIFLNNNKGVSTALEGNPNEMTTEGIQTSGKYNDIDSINAWDENMQNEFMSNTLNHNSKTFTKDGTVKCYITRNIPIRYKCSYTLLSYGETMGENGTNARKECESECYESFSCVNVDPDTKKIEEIIEEPIFIDTTDEENYKDEATVEKILLDEPKIEKINFDINLEKNKYQNIYLDIQYTNKNDDEQYIVYKLNLDSNSLSLNINEIIKSIKIKIYSNDKNIKADLKNIKLTHSLNQKFICPKYQDLSNKNPGDFAHLCPSGKIKYFQIGLKNYQICEDYGIIGDNKDGTFSTNEECSSICRKNHSCKLDITSFNTDILKEFQEGCIEGQTNCKHDTCKELRLNGARILNENIFRAGEYPVQTIVNGTQQQGVIRPRPLLSEDIDYLKRNDEEWKDEAYKYMIDNKRFTQANNLLNEDTFISSAYQIGLSQNYTTSNNYSLSGSRSLYARVKPKAFDVNGSKYKFYAVIDAVIEKYKYNENAQKTKIKDRILYLKTSEDDTFKPFAVKRNFARNVTVVSDNGGKIKEQAENQTAIWEFKSFDNGKWYSHSGSNIAEYFKNEKIEMKERPNLKINVINHVNFITELLPGIVRSVTKNGLYEKLNYFGPYDGSGEALARFSVYIIYSKLNYDYDDILAMIKNQEIIPFYDSVTKEAYPNEITSDTGEISDISIFQYGRIENKSAYLRIFPKEEELGKKGFIYVFAY